MQHIKIQKVQEQRTQVLLYWFTLFQDYIQLLLHIETIFT